MPQIIEGLELFSINDVAIVSGYSNSAILKKMKGGVIDYHKVGNSFKCTRKQVEQFIDTLDLPPNTIDYRLNLHENGTPKQEAGT